MITRFEVIVRRKNGRLVKASRPMSKYAAKRLALDWEDKYDGTYHIEIRPVLR